MDVIKRRQWGAEKARQMSPNSLNEDSILFVHWSTGKFNDVVDRRGAKEAVLEIQRFHIHVRGWADVGYSYLVVQERGEMKHALILEGRRFCWVPAAQEGHNTGNGAVCVLMGPGEDLKDGTIAALRQVYAHFPGTRVKGHRDVLPTACPGGKLYRRLSDVRRAPKRTPLLP